jgi:hypothetical protein
VKRLMPAVLTAFLVGYCSAILVTAPANHLPHSGKECQLVQIQYASGWSEPMTKTQARDRTKGHTDQRRIRFVPLDSTSWYESWHGHGIVRCLAAQRFHVSAGTAIRVGECESSFYPKATNGKYRGVYQQSPTFWSSGADRTNIGKADKQPGGADVLNAFSNIWVALSVAQHTWSPWACHG